MQQHHQVQPHKYQSTHLTEVVVSGAGGFCLSFSVYISSLKVYDSYQGKLWLVLGLLYETHLRFFFQSFGFQDSAPNPTETDC